MFNALPLPPVPATVHREVGLTLWRIIAGLATVIRGIAFWASILLPLAYVPVLSGAVGHRVDLLLGLILVNVLCVVVGHRYTPHT